MGSDYSYRGEMLWVSNGTADTINQECRRRLAQLPAGGARDKLEEHLAYYEHMGSGCLGFAIDEDPLDDPEVRTLFAHALARFAVDVFAAIRGDQHPPELEWLVTLDPFYQASWLADLETLHDMVRRSLRGAIEALHLPAGAELRTAIGAHGIWRHAFRRDPPHRRADVEAQRAHLAKIVAAPRYFSRHYIARAHDLLAEREAWIGDLEAAAATRLRGADYEDDPETAALTRELAAYDQREAAFLRDIWSAPDDDGPREVFADWLLQQGEPRGELIMLQLRGGDPAREAELLAQYGRKWLGPLAHAIVDYRYARGFVAWARVDPAKAADLAGHPAWATVTETHDAPGPGR